MYKKVTKLNFYKFLQKQRKILIALFALMVLLLIAERLYRWFLPQTVSTPPLVIQTITAKEGEMPEVVEAIGFLSATKEVKLKALSQGKIQQILVEGGRY